MPENAIASDDEGSGASVLLLRRRPFFWREMRSAARNEKKCIEGKNLRDGLNGLRGRFTFFSSTLSRRVRHRGFCQQEEIASLRVSDLWKKSASDFGGENAVELVDEMQIINRL